MVDALHRAQEIVTSEGCIVDLHPTATSARVEIGTRGTGRIDAGDIPHRHAAASTALAAAVHKGLLIVESATEFMFYTYGIRWRNSRPTLLPIGEMPESAKRRCDKRARRCAPGRFWVSTEVAADKLFGRVRWAADRTPVKAGRDRQRARERPVQSWTPRTPRSSLARERFALLDMEWLFGTGTNASGPSYRG